MDTDRAGAEHAVLFAQARALSPPEACLTGVYAMSIPELRAHVGDLRARAAREAHDREMRD